METMQRVRSDDITLGDAFRDFYVVPDFQREYVWEEEQVAQLLQDIYEEFSDHGGSGALEYFIGTIVATESSQGVYDLIDGQQRMTTTYLILCAIRDHLLRINSKEGTESLTSLIKDSRLNEQGKDEPRYRVFLQYEDSCGVLERIADGKDLSAVAESTKSVRNLLEAHRVIRGFLSENFANDETRLRRFLGYLTTRVKLIRVTTGSLAHALKVFETINDRGVGLNSMDLLKNLLFMRTRSGEFARLKRRWEELVKALHKGKEKPLRFLRYYIFAEYDVDRLREVEIYKWFVQNEDRCGYSRDPIDFVERLVSSARAYVNFARGFDANGQPNRYLGNFRYLSGAARQHLILLLAARHLPAALFTELARELENLFFVYVITREPTREFERTFAQWTKHLRAVGSDSNLEDFLGKTFMPAKKKLAARFGLAMSQLTQFDLQMYRLKYVLAKLCQYVDMTAWGEEGALGTLETYINRTVDVEHILSQTPEDEDRNSFDQPEKYSDYVYKLGNLTLLEKPINSSVSNASFEKKRSGYCQSKFLLTQSLCKLPSVGKNTSVNRAAELLEVFDQWTSGSIEQRQRMLTRLAEIVWDMPATTDRATPASN